MRPDFDFGSFILKERAIDWFCQNITIENIYLLFTDWYVSFAKRLHFLPLPLRFKTNNQIHFN